MGWGRQSGELVGGGILQTDTTNFEFRGFESAARRTKNNLKEVERRPEHSP